MVMKIVFGVGAVAMWSVVAFRIRKGEFPTGYSQFSKAKNPTMFWVGNISAAVFGCLMALRAVIG